MACSAWLIFLIAMPQYTLFISNQHRRIKYPKSYDLPDVEAAHQVALRVAQVFVEVVPYWNDLTPDQQDGFMVEIDNEGGQTILSVPFREAQKPDPLGSSHQNKEAPPGSLN
jgi:hypothetical protein